MKGSAIWYDAISVRQGTGFPFEAWYQNHYLPAASAATSWLGLRRYGSPALGTYVAVFEAKAIPAGLKIPEAAHEAVTKVERYIAHDIGARAAPNVDPDILETEFLYPVMFRVPGEREGEFDRWYEEEHLGLLLQCRYWQMCRRFKVVEPAAGSHTHIALHYLSDLRALESPERDRARSTPWRDRLAAEEWFRGEYRVYHRHSGRKIVRAEERKRLEA